VTQLVDRPDTRVVASVLFAGENTVASRAVRQTLVVAEMDDRWADHVVAGLRPDERAVSSLSFAPGGPAIAHRVAADDVTAPVLRAKPARRHSVTYRPSEQAYADAVTAALGMIAAGELDKVVLGRCVDVVSEPRLDPTQVMARLLADRPGRYVFGLPLTESAGGPVLLGASPELLVRRCGAWVSSLPLAGSVPRSTDPGEDRRRAADLQDSTKDLAEHAYVVEAILAALGPACVEIETAPRPRLVTTDSLHHLGTPIRARLATGNHGLSALHLARLLQPTPAVGGVPAAAALTAIEQLEPEPRGPLAGAVGWVDGTGDGEFAVTIRAGVLDGERLRLFAGAGIVAASDPDSEVRETAAKLRTMMRAVGL
jgi:isochorismate synthase